MFHAISIYLCFFVHLTTRFSRFCGQCFSFDGVRVIEIYYIDLFGYFQLKIYINNLKSSGFVINKMTDHKTKISRNLEKQIDLLQNLASSLREMKAELKNDVNKFAALKLPIMTNQSIPVEPSTSYTHHHDDYVITSLRPLDLDI